MAAQESLKKEILAVSRRAENALCVDCYADDTRILTDRGFLFRTELEALLESGVTIEYACYDVAKDALVYSRGLFSRYPNRHGTLVNFTYVKPTATSRDNHLSLRVTPSHDVYVTWCDSGSAWRRVSMPDGSRVCAPPVKVKASSLPIPPCECEEAECVHSQAKVRFLAAAGGGATPREANKAQQTMYDALGLKDRAQVNAFLEIYGFWLGDGTLDLRRPTGGFDAVSFTQRKESDIAWLRSQLAAVGLVKGSDWREYDLADNCVKFAVFAPSWISLFHTEYQSKYQYLEQCSNELEEYEPWPESDGESDDTESEDEVEAEADAGMAAWTPPAPELSDARSGVDAAARGVKRDADEIESPADDAAARHPPQPAPAAAAAAAVASSSSGPVPAGGPATVFTPVRQIALDVEAARGGDHAVMYPFAHTYAGPGSYQPYQNAPVRVLYQLHGPRHQLFGRHADGVSVAQTFAVLDAAAGIAGVPLAPGSGHVISELVPIVWDSWHSEEIARLLWDAPRGLGTYAPVARASVQASIRSGAVVIVAFGGHVKERYRELKALDTQVQQILHIGFYPIAVDGRQVWVVECPHPSEPSAQSVVVAAMACAEVLVDGNVPNDETLDRLTKMQRVSAKSAKWLAPWVLTSLTAEEIRLVIQGVWRADGAWAGQKGAIYTSSTSFRDELIIACLHAGYSPYFSLVYLAGTVRGYYLIGDAKHSRVYKASEISGREAEFMPILATKDAWCVHFTPKRKQGAHPHIPRQMIVTEKYEGIVWCVTVEHKDQLVVVQSAEVNEGVVTKASRPVIAGNCRMPQPTWASFNLGIFMCMTCAGHHRSLGTHITRVRSVTMDNWDAPSVALMSSVGNLKGNQYWEARLPAHQRLNPSVDDRQRADFIRAKYLSRAFYGAPAGSAEDAAKGPVVEEKPMSKMEQRQARLQARAGAAQPASAAPVPAPSANIRQSSVPVSSSSSSRPATNQVSAANAGLFAGMNVVASPATTAATPAAATVSAPAVKTPARVHSSSPWVTRSDVIDSSPQTAPIAAPQAAHHHSHAHSQPPTAAAVVNLLDFSASDQPAVHPAPGHAVDDMFAGLSVAEPSVAAPQHQAPKVTTSSTGNELLDFYSNEPASAPARSQHTTQQQHQPQQQSSFGFIMESSPASSSSPESAGGAFPDLYAAPAPAATSSFSFLSESASTAPSTNLASAQAADSAFSFLGDGAADASLPILGGGGVDTSVPDMNTLIVLPGQYGMAAPMPQLVGAGGGLMGMPQQQAIPGFLAPMTAPLTHSHSQPLQGAQADLFGGGGGNGGFAGGMQTQFQQPHSTGAYQPTMHANGYGMPPQQQQNGMNGMGHGFGSSPFQQQPTMLGVGGGSLLQPLPPFAGAMNNAPAVPQFSVVSVQATQRAQQQAAFEVSNDPFAGLSGAPHASPSPSMSPPLGSAGSQHLQPKGPNQCEVDGCDGKKVARGLCAKHIRGGGEAGASSAPAVQQSSPASSFDFLAGQQAQPVQQQSSFGFM